MVLKKSVTLPDGTKIPALGQGTWVMGEDSTLQQQEITALKLGIEHGLTLIDTAEMYGNGGAEIVVGKAIKGIRDKVFIVSKVLPINASFQKTILACNHSLKRLQIDCLDMYLLHWRGVVPLTETFDAMQTLVDQGKIKRWGVSNFDIKDLNEVESYVDHHQIMTNQILYNLSRRGIEFDLLPWCRQKGLPCMAYSPIERGSILSHQSLIDIAHKHNATPAQIALAWVLRTDDIIAIPKASSSEHVIDNIKSLDIKLTSEDLALLDKSFPEPKHKIPLEMH